MSVFKGVFSLSNIIFLLAGLVFLAVAALNEGSIYSVLVAIACFIAVGLSFRESLFFASPWRVATAVAVLIITLWQVIADAYSPNVSDASNVGSIILNGALFILLLGVTLTSLHPLIKETNDEDEEAEHEVETKKKKKITYEV